MSVPHGRDLITQGFRNRQPIFALGIRSADPTPATRPALGLGVVAVGAAIHEGTLSFTASTTGTYQYLCPVSGHAQKGMAGSLIVRPS
jgi:hypothetical protein